MIDRLSVRRMRFDYAYRQVRHPVADRLVNFRRRCEEDDGIACMSSGSSESWGEKGCVFSSSAGRTGGQQTSYLAFCLVPTTHRASAV